jgi:tetratricopeptide (TPR) repeat protein
MEAHADLAQCYMAINDIDQAMMHIKTYQRLTESNKTDMLNMKADAERHLANLYWKKGDRENALKNYKAFFQDAKNDKVNKDRHLVDNARISLGLARGTHNMGKYFAVVT